VITVVNDNPLFINYVINLSIGGKILNNVNTKYPSFGKLENFEIAQKRVVIVSYYIVIVIMVGV